MKRARDSLSVDPFQTEKRSDYCDGAGNGRGTGSHENFTETDPIICESTPRLDLPNGSKKGRWPFRKNNNLLAKRGYASCVRKRISSQDRRTSMFYWSVFQLPKGNFLAVRPQIIQEYRRIAKQFIPKRVAEISAQIGLYPSAVKINSAKGRWGSCSGKHSLNFSWRLIWASPETVDYVIIHELCHIRHHNHSPDFWSLVASFLPNYRELRENLKQISRRLEEENWIKKKNFDSRRENGSIF